MSRADCEPIDVLVAFVQALRASRHGSQDAQSARRRATALSEAVAAVEASGERLGAWLLSELADEQKALADRLEQEAAEREAAERRRVLASICEMERHAADADGGWTDYGVSDWYRDIEAWAAGSGQGE